jgi:hypothetical protein
LMTRCSSARNPACVKLPACPRNFYKEGIRVDSQCTPCPENMHTVTKASISVDQCICDEGFKPDAEGVCQGSYNHLVSISIFIRL